MTHPERDQDLLLFAHGALPPLRAALTRFHLARCPECRQRVGQFRSVSQDLAGAIRGRQGTRWSLPAAAGGAVGIATAWTLAAAVLLVVLLGTLLGTLAVRQHRQARRPPAVSAPCRPDLPSDRCR